MKTTTKKIMTKLVLIVVATTVCLTSSLDVFLSSRTFAAGGQTINEAEDMAKAKMAARSLYYCVYKSDAGDYNNEPIKLSKILGGVTGVGAAAGGTYLTIAAAALTAMAGTGVGLPIAVGAGAVASLGLGIAALIKGGADSFNSLQTEQIVKDRWFEGGTDTHGGAWMEKLMQNEYGKGINGEFPCDILNGALPATVATYIEKAAGATVKADNLACENGGVFVAYQSEAERGDSDVMQPVDCLDTFQNDKVDRILILNGNSETKKDNRVLRANNLDKTIKSYLKTDPAEFTDLELYMVYKNTYSIACTTNEDQGNGTWQWDDGATTYYKKKDKTSVGVMQSRTENQFMYIDSSGSKQPGKTTCGNIYNMLNEGKLATVYETERTREDAEGIEYNKNPTEDTRTESDFNKEDMCAKTSGLSWLLCPIIELASKATNYLYEQAIEPFLQVEPQTFKTDSPTHAGWEKFVAAANIALVIFLLIIIFSQLTGFGIDNYGIKKSLPKLLIAVLLINLSYTICQACVDLSNILGKSLKDLFEGMIQPYSGVSSETGTVGAIAAGAGSVGVVAAGISIVGGTAAWGAIGSAIGAGLMAALPMIITALLSALISVFFLFLTLGARQAGIIVLVVVSPIAFASYMLPNTKKYFDKWKQVFTALLLVYPICGALMGGAAFASSIIIGASAGTKHTFIYGLVGLLVSVCPFFLIPSIVKSSMQGLGNLGNKISGLGKRAGMRISGTVGKKVAGAQKYQTALDKANLRKAEKSNEFQSKRRNRIARFENGKEKGGLKGGLKGLKDNNFDYDKMTDKEKEMFDSKHQALAAAIAASNGVMKDTQEKFRNQRIGSRPENQIWNKDFTQGVEVDELDENGNPTGRKKHYFKDENGNWTDSEGDIQNEEMAKKLSDILDGKINMPDEIEIDGTKFKLKDGAWREVGNENNIASGKTLDALNEKYQKIMDERNGMRVMKDGHEYEKREVEETNDKGETRKVTRWQRKNADGTYSDIKGNELEGVESAAANNRLRAIGGKATTYHSDGFGDFEDAAGNKLSASIGIDGVDRLKKRGAVQSYDQLMGIKEAQQRAQGLGDISGYAGQSAQNIARASLINAQSGSISRVNQTLGNADAILDVRRAGGITETTRTAAGQSAIKQVQGTASANISAAETYLNNQDRARVDTTARIKNIENNAMNETIDAMVNARFNQDRINFAKNQITNEEKVELITHAKNGTLGEIIKDTSRGDMMRSVAQTLVSDYGGASQFANSGSAEIKERIDNSLINLASGSSVTTGDKLSLTKAMKNGTITQDIINNPNMSAATKAIATRLIEKNGGSEVWENNTDLIKNAIDSTAMGLNIATQKGNTPVFTTDMARQQYRAELEAQGFRENLNIDEAAIKPDDYIGATGILGSQSQQAVTTGTVRLQNQFKQEAVGNKVGEVDLDANIMTVQQENRNAETQAMQDAYSSNIDQLRIKGNETAEANLSNAATRRVFMEAAKNQVKTQSPNFDVILAGEGRRQARGYIEDIKSAMMSNDGYEAPGGITIRNNDMSALKNALSYLRQNGTADDKDTILALSEMLRTHGGDGTQVIADEINSGAFSDQTLWSIFRSDLLNDPKVKAQDIVFFKSLQNQDRSPSGSSWINYGDVKKLDSLKTEYVGTMTDTMFESAFGKVTNGNYSFPSGYTKNSVTAIKMAKLARDTLIGKSSDSIKVSQKEILQKLCSQFDWDPDTGEPTPKQP